MKVDLQLGKQHLQLYFYQHQPFKTHLHNSLLIQMYPRLYEETNHHHHTPQQPVNNHSDYPSMAQTPGLLPNAVQNAPDESCRAPITTDALQALPDNSITSPRTTTIEDPMGNTKVTINVTGTDDMSTNNMSISDMSTNVELIRDRVTQHLAQHPHTDIHKVHAEYITTVERIRTLQKL